VDLLAHLVAAAARPGADQRRDRAFAPAVAQRAHALLEHARVDAPPAGVDRRHRALRGEEHRQAVRDEHQRRRAAKRGRLPVLLGVRPPGAGRLGGAPHGRAVDLAAVEEALARTARGLGHPAAVLVDVRAVVVGQAAEVQGLERTRRDAAVAGREQRAGAAGQPGRDVVAGPGERRFEGWQLGDGHGWRS
jgi:hypothetical protein